MNTVANLSLVLGGVYLNTGKKNVTIVHEYDPNSNEYQKGFRFKGDDGFMYTADGGIAGQLGDMVVTQQGARSLSEVVSVPETKKATVKETKPKVVRAKAKTKSVPATINVSADNDQDDGDMSYFRTQMGTIIALVGILSSDDRFYDKGYRYVSDQGSRYRPDGITVESGLWTGLNLVDRVPASEVPEEDKVRINKNLLKFERRQHFFSRANLVIKRYLIPVEIGVLIGVVLAA